MLSRKPRRGLAHFAEAAEQNVPVPFSEAGFSTEQSATVSRPDRKIPGLLGNRT